MARVHDAFCRCRACKPPLVGQERDRGLMVGVLAGYLVGLVVVAVLIRQVLA